MLRKACLWLVVALLAIALIAASGWLFGLSEPFGHCIHQRKNGHAFQALHKEEFFIVQLFVRVRLNAVCSAHVANVYQGAITAFASVAVAVFTATLWWVTLGQLTHLRESMALAHADRISIHRPRLRIHNIRMTPGDDVYRTSYEIVNVGGTAATIIKHEVRLVIRPAHMDHTSYREFEAFGSHVGSRLVAGARLTVEPPVFCIDPKAVWGRSVNIMFDDLATGERRLHTGIWGFVDYVDDLKNERRTMFSREIINHRFTMSDPEDTEHNYEE